MLPNLLARMHLLFFVLCLLVCCSTASAQQADESFSQSFSLNAGQEEALPFWLSANQFGVIPSHGTSGQLRIAYTKHLKENHGLTYNVGMDAIGRAANDATFFFQQLYAEAQWGPFLLRAGRKEETAGRVHPSLSLGSMVQSNNAAPITGISLSWPEFVTVPGTSTFLAIKGGLKHGWIDGYRITTNPWLHAKSFYFRFGSDTWPVHGYAGLLHYAVWGGSHRNPAIGDLPSTFNDFLRVFFFRGAREGTTVDGEFTNALGNSVGIYDFALEIELSTLKIKLYRQFYLEDTVSTRFRNVWDGLWGLGFSFTQEEQLIEELLWEHVNTRRQGSRAMERPGTDNYYNHFVYSSGWTHRGRSIGTPAILTRPDQIGVYNNILLAQHIALSGSFSSLLDYEFRFTYTRNYGANRIHRSEGFGFTPEGARFPEALDQYYSGLDLEYTLSDESPFMIFTRLAYDWGELQPKNNFGFSLGIVRTGRF